MVGIRVLLRCKRCDSDFYAGRIVSSESLFLGSDYGKCIKECPFCMTSETYFQEISFSIRDSNLVPIFQEKYQLTNTALYDLPRRIQLYKPKIVVISGLLENSIKILTLILPKQTV